MKIIASLSVSLLFLAGALPAAHGDPFRTDINPASIYYQAFLLEPRQADADRDYLFTNHWQGLQLPDRFGSLIGSYGTEIKYLHRAAAQTVPCDWGIDMSPGPETILPELAYCKRAAQMSRLHAMRNLQLGNEAAASEDLLGALAVGRNASRDGTMIGVLVQIAIENIVVATVAENFNHFTPPNLQQLADGFDAPPARGTVAGCISAERFSGGYWLNEQIQAAQKDHPGDETAIMAELKPLVERIGYENQTNYWQEMTNAAGGTVAGLLNMTQGAEAFAGQIAPILSLPPGEFEPRFQALADTAQKDRNFLVTDSLDSWFNSRRKEIAIQVELAMVKAAIQYKLNGDAGLKSVTDPGGSGPFTFDRFVFQGEDRGFKLTSAYVSTAHPQGGHAAEFGFQANPKHTPVTMIFVEKDGPLFNVSGLHAGAPVAP